jgi:hypothetical protein
VKTSTPYLIVLALVGLIAMSCGGGGGGGNDGGITSTNGTNTTSGTNANNGGTSGQMGVTGRVRTTTQASVSGATVRFFDASGAELTPVTTDANGRFTAPLPASARTFTVTFNTQSFYVSFGYSGREYLPGDPSCRAALPPLSVGQTTNLASDIVLTARTETPPPAPDGCLGGP